MEPKPSKKQSLKSTKQLKISLKNVTYLSDLKLLFNQKNSNFKLSSVTPFLPGLKKLQI